MIGFLADPTLVPLWSAVRSALDRNGLDWRGRLTLPDLLPEGRRRLGVIIERPVPAGRRQVAMLDLVAGVERIARTDLLGALTELGVAPTGRRELQLARQQAHRERRQALDNAVAVIGPAAPWAPGWAESAWNDGLFAGRTADGVSALVGQVSQVLAFGGSGRSRTEIAARVLGDAHALDSAGRLAALVTRALVAREGPGPERTVWERAGMPLDLVSAPVLTWALPLIGEGAVAQAARVMTGARLPLHISTIALRRQTLLVDAGTPILVVENPRLVEAAAQRALPAAVISTNGNPTTAPFEAITALRNSDARLRYHGDFDSPGLAIATRACEMGCAPFQMSAVAYSDALAVADSEGVVLPSDSGSVPETPWDPDLAVAFARRRLVVHEERLMDEVLAAHANAESG